MEWIGWVFSGIGTQILSAVVIFVVGAFTGYKVGVRKSSLRQIQKAGDNSTQSQVGKIQSADK